MKLIRDVLDKQLIDNQQRPMGKVDGIIMEVYDDGPPRVSFIEVGGVTLARRLHPRLGRWIKKLARVCRVTSGEPFRISWSQIVVTGIDVTVALDLEDTPALAWELWFRKHIIGRIPGA